MDSSLDLIARRVAECIEKIEEYKREISGLRRTIRD